MKIKTVTLTFILLLMSISILKSSDTWSSQESGTSNNLQAIHFFDKYQGWAVGDQGIILSTSDGGKNWSTQTSGTSVTLMDVFFIDSTKGWCIGSGSTVLYTENGGSSWNDQTTGVTSNFKGVNFINDTVGYITGDNNTIIKTTNGGTTWSDVSSIYYPDAKAISFINEQEGWICGGTSNGTVLHTTNGGSSWSIEYPSSQPLYDVAFIDAIKGFAVGGDASGSIIIKTTDGGNNWSDTSFADVNAITGISILDENNIWCSVRDGKILHSSNGGSTWEIQETGTTKNLQDVSMVNKYKGWIAGIDGTILMKDPRLKICIVTVDSVSGKNMVIWERYKGQGFHYFKIFKLDGSEYILLDSVYINEQSTYIDYSSEPKVHSAKYKISAVDSSGTETAKSPFHETINLQVSQGVPKTTYNLDWNYYQDESSYFVPDYYYIYRGQTKASLTIYDSVSGTNAPSYNDNNVNDIYYYFVSVKKIDPCVVDALLKASSGPFSQSISNLEDNRLKEQDILELGNNRNNINIYPNPASDNINITVNLPNTGQLKVSLHDIMGREQDVLYDNKISAGTHTIEYQVDKLTPGVYMLRFEGDGSVYTERVVVE